MKGPGAVFLCVLFLGFGTFDSAGAFVMVKDGLPMCFIVLSADAGPAERYAAGELTSHIKLITGTDLPVREMAYGEIPPTGRAVIVGNGDWREDTRFKESVDDMEMLGDQGFVIKSFTGERPEVLILSGRSPRGTVYAVYELLRKIGVRWYTKDITDLPSLKLIDLGGIDIGDLPCFEVRDVVTSPPDDSGEWKARLRLSAGDGFMEEELGCRPVYNAVGITVDDCIPRDLFVEMQELFPLVDGVRSPEHAGRCFSNQLSAAAAADTIEAVLSRHPKATVVSVRFPEYNDGCRCDRCTAVREREKSESGLVLSWLNNVARKLVKTHPDIVLEFNADGILKEPPSALKPAENIVVRLNTDALNQLRFYEESIDVATMEFMEYLLGWRGLNARVTISHPSANLVTPAAPFPDFRAVFRNIEMYHYEFVEGCSFECSAVSGIFVSSVELRTWILSELMWDRYRDGETLVREWMRGVYGNARGAMMDYWKHVQSIAESPEAHVTAHTDPLDYISDDWLKEADRILQRAYAISMTDSTARRNVKKERLSVAFVRLLRAMKASPASDTERERFRSLSEAWEKDFVDFGYDRVSENQTVDDFVAVFRAWIR